MGENHYGGGETIGDLVRRHDQEIYRGNGKPGLKERIGNLEKSVETITFYGRWLLLTMGGLIVVGILNLIMKH